MIIPHVRHIRILIISILVIFSFGESSGQQSSYDTHIQTGLQQYEAGNFKSSLNAFRQAFQIRQNNATDLYNAACSAARLRKKKIALDYLDKSLALGYDNADHLEKDSDLYSLHASPRWKQIIEEVRHNAQTLSSTAIFSRIVRLIEKNNSREIIALLREYDSYVDEAQMTSRIDSIYQLLQKTSDKTFSRLKTSSKSQTSITNGILSQGSQLTYYLPPVILKKNVDMVFNPSFGYQVHIMVKKDRSRWQFSKIQLVNTYFLPGYNLESDIEGFMAKASKVDVAFNFVSLEQSTISGSQSVEISALEFLKTPIDLVYVPQEKSNEILTASGNWITFTLSVSNGSDIDLAAMFDHAFNSSKFSVLKIEFVFNDANPDMCFISNGSGYAIYETKLAGEIKKFILKELRTVE